MKLVRRSQAPKDTFEAPYERTVSHMITPWTVGSEHLWIGVVEYPVGSKSNAHTHEDLEEAFYCVSGTGQIRVNDKVFDIESGDAVYVAPGEEHAVINNGIKTLELVSTVSPPLSPTMFKSSGVTGEQTSY